MSDLLHVIVWIDYSQARIFHLGISDNDGLVLYPHSSARRVRHQANSTIRGHVDPKALYFAQITEVIREGSDILILGPSTAKVELARYIRKRSSETADRIVALEAADRLTDDDLLAYGRVYFRMSSAGESISRPFHE
ncbi:hypothetical protein SAMN05216374_4750 [Tardiphaga sp. OK246]|jgi:stalled ribosome rescue protein Dom34|uniref:hypothetical protein n=1 Tax=Tardiphaga sp. OK246 TaxID=1855307 RepID=UPI000B6DE83F|nr:hypothetical protein [Tardiphaga sp. OK246]SNT53974.1 hypothetical protein SAMN05216374_4750 [Tardiphaga sp. OK246]